MSQAEAPRLEAWVDTEADGDDRLHVRVEGDGHEFERVDVDLDMLIQTEQYMDVWTRPALTLLTLWERAVVDEDAPPVEVSEAESEPVPGNAASE